MPPPSADTATDYSFFSDKDVNGSCSPAEAKSFPSSPISLPPLSTPSTSAPSTARSSVSSASPSRLLSLLPSQVENVFASSLGDVRFFADSACVEGKQLEKKCSATGLEELREKGIKLWMVNFQASSRDTLAKQGQELAYLLRNVRLDHIYVCDTPDARLFTGPLLQLNVVTEVDFRQELEYTDRTRVLLSDMVEMIEKKHFFGSLNHYHRVSLPQPPVSTTRPCKKAAQRRRLGDPPVLELGKCRRLRPVLKKEVAHAVDDHYKQADCTSPCNVLVIAEGKTIKEMVQTSINRCLNNKIKAGSVTIVNVKHKEMSANEQQRYSAFLAAGCRQQDTGPLVKMSNNVRPQSCRRYDNGLISYVEVYNDVRYLDRKSVKPV